MKQLRRTVLALAGLGILATLASTMVVVAQAKATKPLRITVYGGSGAIGSRIVNEAAARGHRVIAVDRNPRPDLAPKGVKVVRGDALNAKDIRKNSARADAVVSSVIVRPAPTPDFALRVVQTFVAALGAHTANRPRLLIVGGASSLYNAEGKRLIDTFRDMPASMAGEVSSSVDSLDYLRTVKDLSWTFFSPALFIEPGTRTGKFRLGTEQVLTDASGRSAISMEDYAVAMIDEIEQRKFLNKRFTVGY
jgi:putative NADH-flavin reductase